MAIAEKATSKFVTGKVRLSFVRVFEPDDNQKYSVCVMIPKEDKETIAKYEKALEVVSNDPKTAKTLGGKVLAGTKKPLRDGDTDQDPDKYPEFKGHYFFNASTKNQPEVVGTRVDEFTNKLIRLEEGEIKSGDYARVSVNLYAYNVDGGKGIAAGLNNIQFLAEGESLGGGASRADEDFDVIESDDFLS